LRPEKIALVMMRKSRHSSHALPLVRLSLVEPLVNSLESLGIDARSILEQLSIKRTDIADSEVFVPAPRMYEIVEELADASGDPYFGIHAGEALDPWDWSPLSEAAGMSTTLGEFLLRFMERARQDATSVVYSLKTQGSRSTFRERRITDGGMFPRHNDGFTLAYLLAIIRPAIGSEWDGARVVVHCCDPDIIPRRYLGIRTASTDTMGACISFPSAWLLHPVAIEQPLTAPVSPDLEPPPSGDLAEDFRRLLRPHLHEFGLGMDRVAEICGLSKRTLARRLQAQGTTAQREILALRQEHAETSLLNTTLTVGAIAASVGYANPAVFSRAFKRWTGESPKQYRQSRQRGIR
jgi:AraC-like DNA-binding protein